MLFLARTLVSKRRRTAVLALACLLAVVAATPSRAADSPFEINAVLSLTGQGAYLGGEEQQALQIAQDLMNRRGGIHGRPIKFVVVDDQTSPQVAVQLTNALIAKGAPVILGFGISSTCRAIIPLVAAAGPLTFCFTPAVDEPANSYVFGSSTSTADTYAIGVKFFRQRGLKRIALISATDATGQVAELALDGAMARPENKDMHIVAREHFNTSDVSLSAIVARVKAADPQAIFATATGTPFGTLLHGLRDVGLDVPIYTNNGNATLDQMAQYRDLLPSQLCASGLLGMTPGTVSNGPVHDAQSEYAAAFKRSGVQPSAGHNLAWDATMLTLDGFEKLGTNATAAQMKAYVAGTHGWVGINGVYDFHGAQRGIGENGLAVICWNAVKKNFMPMTHPGGLLR